MDDPVAHLETALEESFTMIRQGDLGRIGALTEQVETGLAALSAARNPERVERILALARRNETCLAAARRGILAARRRLADLEEIAAGTLTYDGQGQRRPIEARTGSLKQRI